MLEFLKRLFGGAKTRKRPDVNVVRITPGAAFDPALIEDQLVAAPPLAAREAPPADLPWMKSHADMVESPQRPGAYMVGLVGEEHCPTAVAALKPDALIFLELEPDNPNDSSAIAAVDARGRIIGYIAPDSWLREAIYGGGASFCAGAGGRTGEPWLSRGRSGGRSERGAAARTPLPAGAASTHLRRGRSISTDQGRARTCLALQSYEGAVV
ncbi:MAG: hypothetical protein KGJ57_08255 [Sphingomonadales bacterium]|nr:hypothetical protein [Sphingomonadales bacterium]MDE2169406.1 hypothetical protein [Sphingomonadales bacterium]